MKKSNLIAVSLLVLGLAPVAAFAGNCNQSCGDETAQVINGQLQLGDVIAFTNVNGHYTQGATASGAAVGNSMSASSQLVGMNVSSSQELNANVRATSDVHIGTARGNTISTAVAQGNAGQIAGCCSSQTVAAQQVVKYGNDITANSHVAVGSSDNVVSAAQAAANNWAVSSYVSGLNQHVGQYNSANVRANSHVDACCNNGVINSSAVAAANNNVVQGEASTIYSNAEQKNWGRVSATSTIHNHSATNNTSVASAVANNAYVSNTHGYAQLNAYQENNGAVNARSVVLNDSWRGMSTSAASAMGNSAIVSNIGSDVGMNIVQNNMRSAPISAYASFSGSSMSGGVGVAQASAIGNAVTGFACSACGTDVAVRANVQQFNYAPVTAVASMNVGSAGMISGSAMAVGNSATFITQNGH